MPTPVVGDQFGRFKTGKKWRNWQGIGNGGRRKCRPSKGGGVGIEDLHGVVAGGAEVRTVIL